MPVQDLVRRSAVIVLFSLLAAACSSGDTPPPPPSSTPASPSASPSSPAPSPSGETITLQIWFTKRHHLFPTERTIPDTPAVGTAALTALLEGPNEEEAAAGLGTAIPAGTELEELDIEPGFALADFSTPVESDPLSDAQVVYALTQFPTIQQVRINDQEGGPLSRKDLEGQLPPIVVEHPTIGQDVSTPVTVAGMADVFEATVSIRILDQSGHILVDTVTMATCGTGCRGEYSKDVEYSVEEDQPGTVMVYEASAEDGRPINVVRIPVTLTA